MTKTDSRPTHEQIVWAKVAVKGYEKSGTRPDTPERWEELKYVASFELPPIERDDDRR